MKNNPITNLSSQAFDGSLGAFSDWPGTVEKAQSLPDLAVDNSLTVTHDGSVVVVNLEKNV